MRHADIRHCMLSVKGPIETKVCSDTGRHIGITPTSPTAYGLFVCFFCVFKLVDFVGFKVESEAPVSTRNDVDLPLTSTIKGV